MVNDSNRNKIIGVLIILILVLLIMVIYAFIVKPSINAYAAKAYSQGANDVINVLFNQIKEQGFTEITLSNKTMRLVPSQN
jgi:competence protein ComGC